MTQQQTPRPLEDLARDSGRYPTEAFQFVREGLQFTVERTQQQGCSCGGCEQQHITGQELCWGLRDYALKRWGLLASTVLKSWNISQTEDFGRLVFALVDTGWMAKTDTDRIEDFQRVYDFKSAFRTDIHLDAAK
jgi:uncharacterized repeat protein (TIGR04138 family)